MNTLIPLQISRLNTSIVCNYIIYTLLLGCLIPFELSAYNYISVEDPQTFQGDVGTIERAEFALTPRGAYMEVGMYLVLSAGDSYLREQSNPLEIVMGFDLPNGAMVVDSWLWINGEIVKADIRDRWTASSIYEEIVGRQQDPSLLVKQGDDQYELRVYPLDPNSVRRVKITYLVPVNWNANDISISLPTELILKSRRPVEEIQVQVFENDDFNIPSIPNLASVAFQEANHLTLGSHLKTSIPFEEYEKGVNIFLSSPMKNGIYLEQFEGQDENYYQLVIQPSELYSLESEEKERVVLLIDYELSNTSINLEIILENLENQMLTNLNDEDVFNVFISETDITPLNNDWILATDENVRSYFNLLKERKISNFSNLPDLLLKGINYIKNNSGEGTLFVVSSGSQVGEPEIANIFINDLREELDGVEIPIYISDYQDRNVNYFWINNVNYGGNEYFYTNIAKLTGGNFSSIREENNFVNTIQKTFSDIREIDGILDIHTTLENGFCYGRHNVNSINSINKPFIEIGKYQGSFPFSVEANGKVNDRFFNRNIHIEEADVKSGSLNLPSLWTGNYIRSIENFNNSNTEIAEIIELSLKDRVLSFYTAFLALEIEQGGVVCEDCVDETELSQMVTVDPIIFEPDPMNPILQNFDTSSGSPNEDITATLDILVDSLVNISGAPNPFSDQIRFEIKLADNMEADDFMIGIYDLNGILIKEFNLETPVEDTTYELIWDGMTSTGDNIAVGMYILNLRSAEGQKNYKFIHIK